MAGKRGRKPTPKPALRPGRCPDPPDWLEESDEALRIWHEFAPVLNRLGLLESLDRVAYAMLCDAVAGYLRIRDEISREELVLFAGDSGYPTPNPLCALMRGQTKAVRELLSDFGMTPTSRSSLTGSTSVEPRTAEEVDPLEQLLQQLGSSEAPATAPAAPVRKPRRQAAKKAAKKRTK